MNKIVIVLIFIICSACSSGNMRHPVYGRDYKYYLLEKDRCEITEKLGGKIYSECMKELGEWKQVKR